MLSNKKIICPNNLINVAKKKGTNVYFIPGGGSNSVGALGYVECLNEIIKENSKYNFSQILHWSFSQVFFASE